MKRAGRLRSTLVAAAVLSAHPASGAPQPTAQAPSELTKLSIEELAGVKVTVAARRPQRHWDVPAATAVVAADDVERSGLTSLPEALRLAPGVQVARVNSDAWAVGIRGFASTLSRSVLALVDGRSVYTPLFGGVYWEQQQVMLADLDRIEVVRGPGGTLWGANAVNGVVSVVTKSAQETHGTYVEAGGGSTERAFLGLRYGGALGASTDYRAYARYFDRGPQHHADGDAYDTGELGQGGFRLDSRRGARDTLTVSGDLYDGRVGQRHTVAQYTPPFAQVVDDKGDIFGADLLGRFTRSLDRGGELSVLGWYDRTDRKEAYLDQSRDTFDLELQHDFVFARRHHVVWGLGFRVTSDSTSGLPGPFFDPEDRTDHIYSGFAQDEFRFAGDRLALTAGAKLEHNGYSGFDVQPSLRLLWAVSPRQRAWVAASRAVRTPSRADTDQVQTVFLQEQGALPIFVRAVGDKQFESESTHVGEAGYRLQPLERLSFEVAGFYDRYADLLGGRIGTPFLESEPAPTRLVIPVLFGNYLEGETWGGELSFEARPLASWRLHGGYSYLRVAVRPEEPPPPRLTADTTNGASPRNQLFVRSSHDLPHGVYLDAFFRYVGEVPAQKVPAYSSLDLRLAWRPTAALELAVVGQNLLEDSHLEWGNVAIRRGVYGRVTWRR
jgi:iron complex outermembrane recepter protein